MFDRDKLDQVLEEIITCWGIPGLVVGIVDAGEIVYARGFGVQSLETQTPVAVDSIFCVASVSKGFVATAMMQPAEQGIIDLSTGYRKFLPRKAPGENRVNLGEEGTKCVVRNPNTRSSSLTKKKANWAN